MFIAPFVSDPCRNYHCSYPQMSSLCSIAVSHLYIQLSDSDRSGEAASFLLASSHIILLLSYSLAILAASMTNPHTRNLGQLELHPRATKVTQIGNGTYVHCLKHHHKEGSNARRRTRASTDGGIHDQKIRGYMRVCFTWSWRSSRPHGALSDAAIAQPRRVPQHR